ncbi:MAG: hypothetical protein ORN58_07630 [Sediminibacterium sp.]|nr:hypothetical protein [Sediminibacterium sp.]
MDRKKWTAKKDEFITTQILLEREKKKWQLNFRRYVIEKKSCPIYAPYFGLTIELIREWYELQFSAALSWEDFGKKWYFKHIIPMSFFDFNDNEDLKLCWNFLNIKIEVLNHSVHSEVIITEILQYFTQLNNEFNLPILQNYILKIQSIIDSNNLKPAKKEIQFIKNNWVFLNDVSNFTEIDFYKLNTSISYKDMLLERNIINKFL